MGISGSIFRVTLSVCVLVSSALSAKAQLTGRIDVRVDRPTIKISPDFYGLMTEEINHAYDGGLYAELLRNRSLKDSPTTLPHWSLVGSKDAGDISLDQDPTSSLPTLKLAISNASESAPVGIANSGYWGVPVKPHTPYRATFLAKASGDFSGPLTIQIIGNDGKVAAQAKVNGISGDWRQYTVRLRTANVTPSTDNRFTITAQHAGTVWFRTVSLFPPTFKNRPNGTRIDLMNLMGELKPSFLRLPGGNYLEGNTIAERFEWKDTLGPVSQRAGHPCPWGYYSTDGLGILEYLEWCEDLHMKPVLAVFAGYALRGAHIDPGPELQPFVQDALDEIEYVTGDPKTTWGARRAKDGHPKPFPLTYVEIGNEDNFDRSGSYDGRYAQFYDAIKAKYPKLQLIATMPVRSRKPDVIDDHYYRSAAEMARDSGHYDKYDRSGSKIFVGEWASIEGRPTPTHQAALGDAAWLIGLERNSDLVVMEAYAPLLVNVNPGASQWQTNLIGYDALSAFGSPSYYVQSMFAKNTGNVELPAKLSLTNVAEPPKFVPHGAVGFGTWRTDAEYKDAEVIVDGKTVYSSDFSSGTKGWSTSAGTWRVEDGALRQSSNREDTRAFTGDMKWTDYTYRVKARKIGGEEGFLILFHVQNSRDFWRWNIGGWGDTRSGIENRRGSGVVGTYGETPTTVETGRWYDVKIVTHGTHVQCYLDDKLITEVEETPPPVPNPFYAGASLNQATGEVFLKLVNVSGVPMTAEVNLDGIAGVEPQASGWELAGQPDDQNSVKEPKKVAPKAFSIESAGGRFTRTYSPYSVTVIRLKVKK